MKTPFLYENYVQVIKIKKPGRKPNIKRTEPHCYMVFIEDVKIMVENGWTPKEVFKLGVLAKQQNPQLISRFNELEENNTLLGEKVQRLLRKSVEQQAVIDELNENKEVQ